jgi:hypothetical protein
MNSFDVKSFLLGALVLSIPLAYFIGKRHAAMWEVTASICSSIEQKQADQINSILKTINISETEPQQKRKGG